MRTLGRALRHLPGAVGFTVVAFWVLLALFAPLVAPHDPLRSQVALVMPFGTGPAGQHFWLGTDMLGRDILSRLIWGTRTVVIYATISTTCAYVVGIFAGLAAGFYRGWIDRVLSFGANVMLSFPVLVVYLLIIVTLGPSGVNIVLAVTFASAPAIFRIVRALTLDIRSRDFVAAAITQGESSLRIMLADILPNATGPLIVDACLRVGYTAIAIGTLGFLGLGLPPPTPDWGGMVNEGRAMAIVFPHLVIFPCIAISSLMLGLSMLADGLREAARAGARG